MTWRQEKKNIKYCEVISCQLELEKMLTFKVTLKDTVYLSRFTNVHSLLTNKRCKVKVNDTLETYRYYTDFTNYTYIHTQILYSARWRWKVLLKVAGKFTPLSLLLVLWLLVILSQTGTLTLFNISAHILIYYQDKKYFLTLMQRLLIWI